MALILSPDHGTDRKVTNAPAPTATTNPAGYPACVTEDGAGQALCWWDAQRQGNTYGDSVVSGDCAYEGDATKSLCVDLHSHPSYTVDNEDGSSHTVPNGSDLVAECQEELQNNNDNWTEEELQECFTAQFDS